jgi:hypothetical protein
MTSTYEVLKCLSNNPASAAFPWRAAALATGRADVRETAERRSLRNEKIFVQCLGKASVMRLRSRDVRRSEGCP